MTKKVAFINPVKPVGAPTEIRVWLEFTEARVLIVAQHEGDGRSQNIAALKLDDDGMLAIMALTLVDKAAPHLVAMTHHGCVALTPAFTGLASAQAREEAVLPETRTLSAGDDRR